MLCNENPFIHNAVAESQCVTMGVWWVVVAMSLVAAAAQADRGGSSLRGALEALQRRQRSRVHPPMLPQPDYDALYEFVPPQGYPGKTT